MSGNAKVATSPSDNSDNAVTMERIEDLMKSMDDRMKSMDDRMKNNNEDLMKSMDDRMEKMEARIREDMDDRMEKIERDIRKLSRKLDNQELEIENIRYSGSSANHVGFREAINATAAIGAPSRRLNSAYYR